MTPLKPLKRTAPLLGAHFSIAGGLVRALEAASAYGCPVVQLFTKNATTWKERKIPSPEAEAFRCRRRALAIRYAASHASYLINLAAVEEQKRRQSLDALKRELARSGILGLEAVVLHPGSHMGTGPTEGIRRIQEGINQALGALPRARCRLLLETTAGQGTGIGHSFDELALIREGIEASDRIGFCLDTAHVFAAGYDLRDAAGLERTLASFDAVLGLKNLNLIHLNDSLKPLGSRVDRHAGIGQGHIGAAAFACIMRHSRLAAIPKILETPKEDESGGDLDQVNLTLLRSYCNPPPLN